MIINIYINVYAFIISPVLFDAWGSNNRRCSNNLQEVKFNLNLDFNIEEYHWLHQKYSLKLTATSSDFIIRKAENKFRLIRNKKAKVQKY